MKLESLKSKKFDSFIFNEMQDAHLILGGVQVATKWGVGYGNSDTMDKATNDGPDRDLGSGEFIDIKWDKMVIPLGGNTFRDTLTSNVGVNGNAYANYPTIKIAGTVNGGASALVTILSHFPEDNPNVALNNAGNLNSAVAGLNNSVVNLNSSVASLNSSVAELKRQ